MTDSAMQRPSSSMSDGIPSAGMGEEDMMSFFRSHMNDILKPFAENVEELHKTVVNLSSSVCELQEKSVQHTETLEKHWARMDAAQGRQDKLIERAEATRTMLEGTIDESGKADKARSMRIDKVDETLIYLSKTAEQLLKTTADTDAKVAKLQSGGDTFTTDILELQKEISGVAKNLGQLDEAHGATIESVKRNKLTFNGHVKDFKEQEQEQRYLRAKFTALSDEVTDKVKTLKRDNAETARQLLEHRKDSAETNETQSKLLNELKDEPDKVRKEALSQLNKINVELEHQSARIEESKGELQKLLKMQEQKNAEDFEKVRANLGNLNELTSKLDSQVPELQSATGVLPGKAQNRVDLLEEEADLAFKRALRLEKILQLDPMTKENADINPHVSLQHGVLLTEEQMQQFQDQFNLYDLDHSGAVNGAEVADILQGLGYDVNPKLVEHVMKEIDRDQSGEVSFEEFCALMTKMLGPDGKLDVDGYMKSLSEVAVREARQNEIVELFPIVQDEIKKQKSLIVAEQSKLTRTEEALQKLAMDHTKVLDEVSKLRKGLDLNDGYWKGMTRGLKDTKKTVYTEGDGQMLPSATRLRNALPPLGSLSAPLKQSTTPPRLKTPPLIQSTTPLNQTQKPDQSSKIDSSIDLNQSLPSTCLPEDESLNSTVVTTQNE